MFKALLILAPLLVFLVIFAWDRLPFNRPGPPDHATPAAADTERADFARCGAGARFTCVIDGDTFWYKGEKIRIADIDTPEVGEPGCPREFAMGERATARLIALLNAGPVTLRPTDREFDHYGRRLLIVTRNGRSLGDVLVREGLAERWGGPRIEWCSG